MNLFISANAQYLYAAKVMLTSFFMNNSNVKHHIFFLCGEAISMQLREFETWIAQYNVEFTRIQIPADAFRGFRFTDRFPAEVYYRLLIPQLVPDTEERALWLDVDLIVNKNIEDFYFQDLGACPLAACADIGDRTDHLQALGVSAHSRYFNSGVLLFNLNLMRKYTLEDYYEYFKRYSDVIIWPDQDILNGLFSGMAKIWDCDIYNVQVSNWRFKGEYDLSKAAIIHYIGNSKPWFQNYTNKAAVYWDIYHKTAFGERKGYVSLRKINRACEKTILGPFREFRGNAYNRFAFLRKLRNYIRK